MARRTQVGSDRALNAIDTRRSAPWADPPDPLLVLAGFEADQLHLDVVAHLEGELRGRER